MYELIILIFSSLSNLLGRLMACTSNLLSVYFFFYIYKKKSCQSMGKQIVSLVSSAIWLSSSIYYFI